MARFTLPRDLYHGKGALEALKTFEGKRAIICVGGGSMKRFGFLDRAKQYLEEAGMEVQLFEGIEPDPSVETVMKGAAAMEAFQPDWIVAIGGGSSMDCAKAVGARLARPNKPLAKMEGILKIWHKLPLLIAVPTTAGTGSETTLAAVITDADTHHKYAINDFNLIPDYAVLEPSVTYGLPPQLTATTGMDALTHAIEAYIGRSTTKQTRAASIEAIQLIFDNLQTAYKNGNDKTARRNMLRASYLAGTAFTKSYVGYVHAVAHSLGGCYGIPHGLANSVLLPIVLKAYGTAAHKKLARLARITGISDSKLDAVAAEEFINHIRSMNISMNIPETLDGIRNEDIPKLACYADKEANPLYPVPALWGPEKLEQMYHLVQEVSEHDRNRNSEHPGKAA